MTANRTCVLLASEDMITQRIDAHLARAMRATVSMGKHLGDGHSETPAEQSLPNVRWKTSYRLLLCFRFRGTNVLNVRNTTPI